MRKLPVLACAALLLSTLSVARAGDDPKVLRFSAIPDHDASELKQKYDPVARYLSDKLEVKVEYIPAADYQASVEMFKNGDIRLAWFGGLTGVQARRAVAGARAIAQGIEDPEYYSYFIAHRSTGLAPSPEFPSAISSLPFSFGSESSTSGRLMPEFFILRNSGKTASEFFEEPFGFSGSHPKTAELVCAGGAVKAGALNYRTYDTMVANGEIDPQVCPVIWETPRYADYNMTAHPDLEILFGIGFIDKLQSALLEMKDPGLLAAFARSGLIAASNAEFAAIESVATELGMLRER